MYYPLDPGCRLALFGLPGLVQRRHDQRLVPQVLGHETAHHALRGVVVPHGVVEQPLHPIRCAVSRVLGGGPAVLARQVTHQRRKILPGLHERLRPAETRLQPLVQHGQIRHRQGALYHGSRSRLTVFLCHNLIIARRLHS